LLPNYPALVIALRQDWYWSSSDVEGGGDSFSRVGIVVPRFNYRGVHWIGYGDQGERVGERGPFNQQFAMCNVQFAINPWRPLPSRANPDPSRSIGAVSPISKTAWSCSHLGLVPVPRCANSAQATPPRRAKRAHIPRKPLQIQGPFCLAQLLQTAS